MKHQEQHQEQHHKHAIRELEHHELERVSGGIPTSERLLLWLLENGYGTPKTGEQLP